jgi:hypothetical protein
MKKTIVSLACCALIAPLAFAQTGSKDTRRGVAATCLLNSVIASSIRGYESADPMLPPPMIPICISSPVWFELIALLLPVITATFPSGAFALIFYAARIGAGGTTTSTRPVATS